MDALPPGDLSERGQRPGIDLGRGDRTPVGVPGSNAAQRAYRLGRDPAAAMDWAKSVTDPGQRSQSVTQIYHMWRSKNAEQADAALDGSGLPPEKITELKDQAAKTTPPKNP